ncbi:MAG TPA: START domain-containing protein [Puia sp.]|nr:START domain-containing protein [Puia sp.]
MILCVTIFSISVNAQNDWRLKKEQSGIKIYMRTNVHSSFNEIKVEMTIQSKLSSLVALLLDVPNHAHWVYNVKTAYVLQKLANNELYFYEVVDSPFPASDRDLVVHLKITQDSITKMMNISAINIPDYIPSKKGIVRVPVSNESWEVNPINNNSLRIEYYLEIDPGGSIPAWLLNNFAEKGPYESFRHLQEQVDNPKYKNATVSFIRN